MLQAVASDVGTGMGTFDGENSLDVRTDQRGQK